MENYTEESIKKEMEEIHETDLQNRLKKLYEEKRKIDNKKTEKHNNDNISKKLKTLEENINLSIKVYERNLPLRIVERAKRSAGIYETEKEISDSVKRGESISKGEKEELEK